MGYAKRTAVTAGLAMGQISEFSLILAALGFSLGHINNPTMSLITLVGLTTIGLSTYMILYSRWLYERLAPPLEEARHLVGSSVPSLMSAFGRKRTLAGSLSTHFQAR
jgi:predicted Kef-type K+ transport protein